MTRHRLRSPLISALVLSLSQAGHAQAQLTKVQVIQAPVAGVAKLSQAHRIHQEVLVLDGHGDLPEDGAKPDDSQNALPLLEQGGVDAVVLAVFTPTGANTPEAIAKARAADDGKLAVIRAIPDRYPGRAAIAYSADDVTRIAKSGKRAILIGYLNTYSLGTDIGAIDGLAAAGVRIFGFTHAGNTEFADSSRPQGGSGERWGGLSPLGREAVVKLNRLGVVIDASQLTSAAFRQTLELTKSPVIASHSGVKGLVDSPRNLSDQELDALKANDGLVNIVAFSAYIARLPADYADKVRAVRSRFGLPVAYARPNDGAAGLAADQRTAFSAQIAALAPKGTVADLIDAVDYAVKRIGIDHVGLASDFNHGGGVVGWSNEGEAENVTAELVRRGYDKEQIAKLWGGNFIRVLRANQTIAKELKVRTAAR